MFRKRPFWEATVQDFVIAFSELNTIELSDLDDPEGITIKEKRITTQLDLAAQTINATVSYAPPAGQIRLRVNFKRLQLDITRYYLDSDKNRTYTRERYEDALEFIKEAGELKRTTPYDAELAKQYGIKPNRSNRVRMVSDKPIPILNRTAETQIYRDGDLYDTSAGSLVRNECGDENTGVCP